MDGLVSYCHLSDSLSLPPMSTVCAFTTLQLRQQVGSSFLTVPGTLSTVGTSCCGKTIYEFSGAVSLGSSYQFLNTFFNTILETFTVVADSKLPKTIYIFLFF